MQRPIGSDARRRRTAGTSGFTLLEVLAAVLIFAVTFTALAGHSMSWVRSQGVSDRRMRAALLADERMTALESQLALGQTPVIDEQEEDEEEFRITVSVEPWAPPIELEAAPEAPAPARRPERAAGDEPSLFAPTPEFPDGFLRRLHVRVEWDEGLEVFAVTRTTFAADSQAVNTVLDAAGLGEPPEAAGPGAAVLDEGAPR